MHWEKSTRAMALVASVAALGLSSVLGCASSTPPAASASASGTDVVSTPAGTQAGEDEEGQKLVEHHRHHHGGVAMFLHMSLDSLGVSDDQRAAVTKIQEDLSAKLEPVHAAQQKVLAVLADGVAAGAVDSAKVDAAIADIDATGAAAHAATADALNQLHTVLTPPQRIALVQKLQAHWQVWQTANAEEGEHAEQGEHEKGERFSSLVKDPPLTADQIDRIRATLRGGGAKPDAAKKLDPSAIEGHMKSFESAFEAEKFDAKTLGGGEEMNLHLPSHGARRMARFYEAAAPVLTPDQRTKVAARLREHAEQEAGK